MRQVVLASGNNGKLRELEQALAGTGLELIAQSELQIGDAVEDGKTFLENALIKARHAAMKSGRAAIADDSGLVVPALGGAPGIFSARYSGDGDAANNRKLLAAMSALQGHERRAWFICVLVYLEHAEDPAPRFAEGRWHGHIAETTRGNGGFGYDPLFTIDDNGRTAAELSAQEKLSVSHRGQAVKALKEQLQRL